MTIHPFVPSNFQSHCKAAVPCAGDVIVVNGSPFVVLQRTRDGAVVVDRPLPADATTFQRATLFMPDLAAAWRAAARTLFAPSPQPVAVVECAAAPKKRQRVCGGQSTPTETPAFRSNTHIHKASAVGKELQRALDAIRAEAK